MASSYFARTSGGMPSSVYDWLPCTTMVEPAMDIMFFMRFPSKMSGTPLWFASAKMVMIWVYAWRSAAGISSRLLYVLPLKAIWGMRHLLWQLELFYSQEKRPEMGKWWDGAAYPLNRANARTGKVPTPLNLG